MPPLAFVILLLCGLLILALPKKYAIIPILVGSIFVSMKARILLGTLDFTSVRIIVLFALIRGIFRGEFRALMLTKIDKTFLSFTIVCGAVYIIREGTIEAFVYRLGIAFSNIGFFISLRSYFDNLEDIKRTCIVMSVILFILGLTMSMERAAGRSVYTAMGSNYQLADREGKVRARGPFSHSSNAGIFTGSSLPLVAFLVIHNRLIFIMGIVGALTATIASNSSGPAMALLYSFIGLSFWAARKKMRLVRWLLLFGLIFLNLVMKAPVWHLMTKVGGLTGGGGWHRAAIIDKAILYFGDWWLMGTSFTAHWMPYALSETEADITNQFIRDGIDGGFISVILLVLVIVLAFKGVGIGLRALIDSTTEMNLLVWGLGVSLVSHVAAFFCTSYFDQVIVGWLLVLAMISSMTNVYFSFLFENDNETVDSEMVNE